MKMKNVRQGIFLILWLLGTLYNLVAADSSTATQVIGEGVDSPKPSTTSLVGNNPFIWTSESVLLEQADSDVPANLTIVPSWTNKNLKLEFINKPSGVIFDLVCATNLGTRPDGADVYWEFLHEVQANETEWIVTNPPSPGCFYRLATLINPNRFSTPTVYVSTNAVPNGDGSKDLPFQGIKAALSAATNYSVIEVAPGTYAGPDNSNLSFGGKKLVLISERGPEQTILDCRNYLPWRAFIFTNNEPYQETFIIGFTIARSTNSAVICAGGSRPTFVNCVFVSNSASNGFGAAVTCNDSSPTFINCRFVKNYASAIAYASGSNAAPQFSHCTFANNSFRGDKNDLYADFGSFMGLNNCIVWDTNSSASNLMALNGSRITANFSDVRGGYLGNGNINIDPLVDVNGRLTNSSPCIDQGTGNTVPGYRLFCKIRR